MNTRIVLAAALVLATLAAAAQTQTAPLVETMEVRVVNVDVVVTDKSGRRVTGLTANDFEIFDGKKPQPITNFSEIDAEAAPETVPATVQAEATAPAAAKAPVSRGNAIIFYIDSSSINPTRRHLVFEELRRFAAEIMKPGDRAAVMSWNRRLHTVQGFTESPAEIQAALREAEKESGAFSVQLNRQRLYRLITETLEAELHSEFKSIPVAYQRSIGYAQTYAEEMYSHSRSVAIALRSTLAAFAAPDDKRALVFVGDYLPARAGAEALQFVEDTFAPYIRTEQEGREMGKSQNLRVLSNAQWLDGLVGAANSAGVTLYMISAGSLHQLDVADAAETFQQPTASAETMLTMDTRRVFNDTARETGGLAYTGGDPRLALQQIADDFRSYYSLGFRPTAPIGKAQSIRVRAKNPDYVVRSRRSYAVRSVADDMGDRVVANLYDDSIRGDLRVRVESGLPVAERRNRQKVPVKVTVQGDKVTLLPRDGQLVGEVTVYVCAGDPEAGASKILRHTQRISIPPADETLFRVRHLAFSFDVLVNAGATNLISAGALDNVSGSWGLARGEIWSLK